MKRETINMPAQIAADVSVCPKCGTVPHANVDLKKGKNESDYITKTTLTCPNCSLSAPIDVWEDIAEKVFEKGEDEE